MSDYVDAVVFWVPAILFGCSVCFFIYVMRCDSAVFFRKKKQSLKENVQLQNCIKYSNQKKEQSTGHLILQIKSFFDNGFDIQHLVLLMAICELYLNDQKGMSNEKHEANETVASILNPRSNSSPLYLMRGDQKKFIGKGQYANEQIIS